MNCGNLGCEFSLSAILAVSLKCFNNGVWPIYSIHLMQFVEQRTNVSALVLAAANFSVSKFKGPSSIFAVQSSVMLTQCFINANHIQGSE